LTKQKHRPQEWDADSGADRRGGSAPRQVLDVLLQSSTVELFHALGIALAPTGRSWTTSAPREHFALVGSASFSAPKANGTLLLSFDDGVYALLQSANDNRHDLLRELTNQLMGRIKNRLLQFRLAVRTGLPSVMQKTTLDRQFAGANPFAAYVFRTLRGEILMTMHGAIDETCLDYANRVEVAKEGEFIEF
jgi:hypothetical protein